MQNGEHGDTPQFARSGMPDHVDVKVLLPRWLVDVIDCEVMSRGGESANVYRATIIRGLLTPWAEKQFHDASRLVRVVGNKPTGSACKDSQGDGA